MVENPDFSYQIEQYKQSDYKEVIRLWLDAGLFLSLSDSEEELEIFANHCQDSFFVMKLDGRIIGTVIGAYDGRRGYIHHLAVHPDYQKKGLGSILMDMVETYYKEIGVVKIHLMIEKSNSFVVSFYKKRGWTSRNDIILMSKTLRNEQFTILSADSDSRYISKSDLA